MTVDFAKEYLLDDCADCPENKDGECMTQSHCFEVKRMAIQALEQTRWIPVSERLPEKSTWVLVTCKNSDGYIFLDIKLINQYTGLWDGDEDFSETVLAWMPLPQPYKAESEDKE